MPNAANAAFTEPRAAALLTTAPAAFCRGGARLDLAAGSAVAATPIP